MAGVKKVNKTTANTTNKSNGNGLKVFILIVLVLFFFVSLVMLWLYASNKPNYNDLNKAYNKLNIPSDWKLVSESSKKGTMGMFCFGGISDTSPCPIIYKRYTSPIVENKIDVNNINNILAGYGNGYVENYENCFSPTTNAYYCTAKGIKNNIGLIVTIGINNDNDKIIDIQMGPKNVLGI